MTTSLENKVIIITGSSSGIGLAIAEAAHKAGASIMLHGSDAQKLAACHARFPHNATMVCADLEDRDAPRMIADATVAAFGRIDGLVNNAGIFPRSNIDTLNDDDFDRIFHINTRAPLMLSQQLVMDCRKRKAPGVIVNIGSINAWCGGEDLLVYSMTKGAIMTMTRNMGDSLGTENIRVNQLNVGWTLTDGEHEMQKSLGAADDWAEHIPAAAAPTGHLLKPEQVAQHAIFWLSDASAPVTGSVYEVEQYPLLGRNAVAG